MGLGHFIPHVCWGYGLDPAICGVVEQLGRVYKFRSKVSCYCCAAPKRGPFGEPFGSFLVGPNATLEVKLQPVLFP